MGAGADELLLEELEMTVVEDDVVGSTGMDVEKSLLVVIVDETSVVVDVDRVEVLSVVIVDVETSLVVGRLEVNVLRSVVDVLEGVVETLLVVVDVTSELVKADVLDESVVGLIVDDTVELAPELDDFFVFVALVLEEEDEVEEENDVEEVDEALVEVLFTFVLLLVVKVGTDVEVLETV